MLVDEEGFQFDDPVFREIAHTLHPCVFMRYVGHRYQTVIAHLLLSIQLFTFDDAYRGASPRFFGARSVRDSGG